MKNQHTGWTPQLGEHRNARQVEAWPQLDLLKPSTTVISSLGHVQLAPLVCALWCVTLGYIIGADHALAGDTFTASSDRPARFAFEYNNDLFAGTDRDYTGATRFAWSPEGARGEGTLFTLSQEAWTPDDTTAERPPIGQHPYTGWLYLSAARATIVAEGTWMQYASIGVLGPSSRAEAVQRFLHKASGSAAVNGWDSELGDRIALQLGLRKDVSALRHSVASGVELDLGAHAGAGFGTVMGYLHAGTSLRIGRGTTYTVGPPDTAPGAPDFAAAFAPMNALYVHIGIGARAVGWDATLDTDNLPAASVNIEPLVADMRAGIVASSGHWRLAYTHVLNTRTYRTGIATHTFGSLNIARSLR